MRMEMNVVGVEDSDALHAFVSSHLNTLKRRFNHQRYHGGKFELRIKPDGKKAGGGNPKGYEVEVIFSLPHTKTLVIRKTSKVAQSGIAEALQAAEEQIRKIAEKASGGRSAKAGRKAKREVVPTTDEAEEESA